MLVPAGTRFLNADVVTARLLAEGHPQAGVDVTAGRHILGELRAATTARESFCVETNLAGSGWLRWIDRWQSGGFQVALVFVALDSPDLAVRRVVERVASGGHHVAEPVVRARWMSGLRCLGNLYLPVVDSWVLLDNSGRQPQEVANGNRLYNHVADHVRWERYSDLAHEAGARTWG